MHAKYSAKVNWPYYMSQALHLAARYHNEASLKLLLAAGAPVAAVNQWGDTPMDVALSYYVHDFLPIPHVLRNAALADLLSAPKMRNEPTMVALAAAGADLEASLRKVLTDWLLQAALRGSTAAVLAAAREGADVNAHDIYYIALAATACTC